MNLFHLTSEGLKLFKKHQNNWSLTINSTNNYAEYE